jgi:large subunit ribosomal protein L7/L12
MACRLGAHSNSLRRRLLLPALHYRSTSGTTARTQPCPKVRQLSSFSTPLAPVIQQQQPRALLARDAAVDLRSSAHVDRKSLHPVAPWNHTTHRQCYRCFHSSVLRSDVTEKDDTKSKESSSVPPASPVDSGELPPKEYSTPELTIDAAKHKAGLTDPTRPDFQNPLHHDNEDMEKIFPEDFDSPEEFHKSISPVFPFDEPDGKVTAPAYLHEIADEIVHLTMLEMNELVNKIADHYGFHEGMLSPDGGDEGDDGAGGDDDDEGGGEGVAVAEKKTAFDVKLVGFDASAKIKVIKEIRSIIPGLGLKEAKELVEGAPKVIQKGINNELAEEIKAKLEALGATIEIV